MLWPPNHDLRLVTLSGGSDPDGDSITITVTGVTSNEAPGKNGPDWQLGDRPNQVWLRAERDGTGDGRIYTIAYTITDTHSASCSGTVAVVVDHDMGR
jgi:hypothetical protein